MGRVIASDEFLLSSVERRFDQELANGEMMGGRRFDAFITRFLRLAEESWPQLTTLCDEFIEYDIDSNEKTLLMSSNQAADLGIKRLFQEYDLNKTGLVSAQSLKTMLWKLDPEFKEEELQRLIASASAGDELVKYEDFINSLISAERLGSQAAVCAQAPTVKPPDVAANSPLLEVVIKKNGQDDKLGMDVKH